MGSEKVYNRMADLAVLYFQVDNGESFEDISCREIERELDDLAEKNGIQLCYDDEYISIDDLIIYRTFC